MMSSKHNFYKKIAGGALVILIIFGLMRPAIGADTEEFQKVEPNKVPDELAMLVSITWSNYEKIKTWQGKISFESTYFYEDKYAADLVKQDTGITIKEPNEIAAISKGTKEFNIDLEKNLSFRSMNRPNPMEYIDLDTGLNYTPISKSYEMKEIVANEYEIESSPYTKKKDGTILTWLAEKRLRNPAQTDFDESDPRYCFSIGKTPWVLLSMMSEGVRRYNKDPNGAGGNMPNMAFSNVILEKAQTEKGAIYRVQIKKSLFEWKYVFEEKNGFNPTHIEVKNDKGIKISEGTTYWIKIQDIFLPAEQQVFQYDGVDGRLRRQAKSTFSDMQVNMVLPENTFSLSNLGLKNGDKFVDKIAGKEYKYQDAELVPIADVNK
jgi:hypothetical protein